MSDEFESDTKPIEFAGKVESLKRELKEKHPEWLKQAEIDYIKLLEDHIGDDIIDLREALFENYVIYELYNNPEKYFGRELNVHEKNWLINQITFTHEQIDGFTANLAYDYAALEALKKYGWEKHYGEQRKYFISGRIICERKDDKFKCTFKPFRIEGTYEYKYKETQKKGFVIDNVSSMIFDDAKVRVNKNRIVADYLGEKKRVCVVYGGINDNLIDCGLSVEEEFEYEKPPSLSKLMRDAERWG